MWWRTDRDRKRGQRKPKRAVLEVQPLEGKALLSGFGVSGQGTQAFVDSLYQTVLHRAPDASGEAYWVAILDNSQVGPRQVLRAFERAAHQANGGGNASVSARAQTTASASDKAFVDNLYTSILHRPADPQGEASWVRGLEMGMSRAKSARMFANSPAALAANGGQAVDTSALKVRAGRNLRTTAPARERAFVDQLYTSILQRPADTTSETYFVNQLQSGASRQQIFNAIVTSAEAQSLGVNPLLYNLGAGYRNGFQLAAPSNRIGLPATPLIGPATTSGQAGTTLGFGTTNQVATTLVGGNTSSAGIGVGGSGLTGTGVVNNGLGGTTIVGGLTPLTSATFIGPFATFPTGGMGTTGFGVGGLTPFTSLGSTALVTPGLNTVGLGAFGTGNLSAIGTLGNVLQTNGLSGPTIGNATGTGGTGI